MLTGPRRSLSTLLRIPSSGHSMNPAALLRPPFTVHDQPVLREFPTEIPGGNTATGGCKEGPSGVAGSSLGRGVRAPAGIRSTVNPPHRDRLSRISYFQGLGEWLGRSDRKKDDHELWTLHCCCPLFRVWESLCGGCLFADDSNHKAIWPLRFLHHGQEM